MEMTIIGRIDAETGVPFPMQRYRDVFKNAVIMEDSKAAYLLILGVENQTDVHYAMPVKNMVYDALNYASQVSTISGNHRKNKDTATGAEYLSGMHKDDKLLPVITLVVYFGQNLWDGPMGIHDLLTANIANDVMDSDLHLTINKKGEIDICVAIAGIKEDVRIEGIAEGRAEGENLILTLIQKLFATGRGAEVQRVSEDAEYRMKIMKEFGLRQISHMHYM